MKSRNCVVVCALAVLVSLTYADASIINLLHENQYGASANVDVLFNGVKFSGPAGVYLFDKSGGTGEGNHWSDGDKTVFGICMDLYQQAPEDVFITYDVVLPEAGPDPYGPMGVAKANLIRELWENAYDPNWAGSGPFTSDQNNQAAAMNVAVWEIIYEDPSNGLNVSHANGDFYVPWSYGNADVVNYANSWLGSLTGQGSSANLRSFQHSDYQDMLTEMLPEPATIILLLVGFLGLIRRKRDFLLQKN